MRVIVAGTRTVSEESVLRGIAAASLQITEVVSGGASGADAAGETYAQMAGVPTRRFDADWNRYGKSAGPRRNRQMADYADAAIVIWDGVSRGSANMIAEMNRLGKPVWVHMVHR